MLFLQYKNKNSIFYKFVEFCEVSQLLCTPLDFYRRKIFLSKAVFCAVGGFLKSCDRFWQHPRDIVHHLCEIRTFLFYFVYISSSLHDKIAIVRLTPAAKVSLHEQKSIHRKLLRKNNPKNRNPQQQKISRNATKKQPNCAGKPPDWKHWY